MTVPVICFLIGHPRGNVLVDTGVHRQALTDPVGRLGEGRASRFRAEPDADCVMLVALTGYGTPEARDPRARASRASTRFEAPQSDALRGRA